MKSFTSSITFAALATILAFSAPAAAQQHGGHASGTAQGSQTGQHTMQGGQMMMGQSNDPAMKDYHAAMQKMHQDMMAKPMSGNPDRDFVMMMLPHHQGAINMAKAQMQHGKDAELKKMSEKMISAQEKEIAELNKWLAEHK